MTRSPTIRTKRPDDPLQAEINKRLEKMRAKPNADMAANKLRDEIAWEPGDNALMVIAGKLKRLALTGRV